MAEECASMVRSLLTELHRKDGRIRSTYAGSGFKRGDLS